MSHELVHPKLAGPPFSAQSSATNEFKEITVGDRYNWPGAVTATTSGPKGEILTLVLKKAATCSAKLMAQRRTGASFLQMESGSQPFVQLSTPDQQLSSNLLIGAEPA